MPLLRRDFPGPKGSKAALRVSMDKKTYAQISAHAAGSTDAEICGILAGTQCEDDNGPFLEVAAAVAGNAAKGACSTHVTFTHETWDVIHQTMEKEHPKLEIVGWYHSHPGFGVEFSEMDIFIQKNFFKANTQVALVIDPLGGHTAMCVDTANGIKYIDKFWVEGREQKCKVPKRTAESGKKDADDEEADSDDAPLGDNPSNKEIVRALKNVQERLGQAIQAVDDQRNWNYRTILFFGMVISVAIIGFISSWLWTSFTEQTTQAAQEVNSWVPVPVMIDGKPIMLGVGIVKWEIPPELNAAFVQVEKERRAAEAATQTSPATQPADKK